MRRSFIAAALATWALLSGAAVVSAQQFGTAEEARAMLDQAVVALKSSKATALSEFNDPDNKQFHEHDLYVFCFNMSDGKITAYSSPALLGVDIRTLTLKDDPIGQRAYDAVQSSPEGTVVTMDHSLPKPGTTEPLPKQSFETRIGNQGCAVDYFK
jgi:hypothetical protein